VISVKRKDVNLKLMPDVHARLTKWCADNGCTKQWKIAAMVGELVAKVELPQQTTEADSPSVKSRYEQIFGRPAPPDIEDEPEEVWDPSEEFYMMLQSGSSIPHAVEKVRFLCGEEGITGWNPPRTLHPSFMEGYRKWSIEQGRDADEDLKALEPKSGEPLQ
jgi:hypothetical protein